MIMIKNMINEIKIKKQYKVIKIKIMIAIQNKVVKIVQKIIFMIVRERVLLATPGH